MATGLRAPTAADDRQWRPLGGRALDPYFEAVVDASEEAVLSSLLSATTTTGVGGRTIDALPTDRLRALLEGH